MGGLEKYSSHAYRYEILSIPQAYQRGVLSVHVAVQCQRRGRIQGAKLYLVYSCYCRRGSISRLAAGRAAGVGWLQAEQQVSVGYGT